MTQERTVERWLLIALVIISLVNMFWPGPLAPVLAIISIGVLLLGFSHLGNAFKWATAIFFALGIVIAFTNHMTVHQIVTGINSMDGLIALLIVMQGFNIPIRIGHYQDAIVALTNAKLSTNRLLYGFTMVVTFLLSSILSMGTVPIIYSILGPTIRKRTGKDYQHFSSVAISRSFTLGTLWAPGAATIFLISTITKEPLQRLFVPSFTLGVLGMILAFLLEFRHPIMDQHVTASDDQAAAGKVWPVCQIVLAVIMLLAIAFTLIHFQVGEAMIDVALAGLLVIIVWSLLLLHRPTAKADAHDAVSQYFHQGVLNGGSLAPFFVAIGLFSNVFEHSQLSVMMAHALTPAVAHLSWGALILVPLLVTLLSIIGIHPLASVTLLGQIMMGIHLPFSTLALALGLNIGSVISYTLSPFAGIVVIIANILNVSSATVSLRWNGKYCLILFVISLIFIALYTTLVA